MAAEPKMITASERPPSPPPPVASSQPPCRKQFRRWQNQRRRPQRPHHRRSNHDATSSSSRGSRCWPFSRLLTARILFLFCLVCVTAGLGYAAYHFLKESEQQLAIAQFASLSKRALHYARERSLTEIQGGVALASVFSNAFPDADRDWPNVALDGYNEVTGNVIDATQGRGKALLPIVYPDQLEAFEEFAYYYYRTRQRPPFESPENIGVSSFGRGVYGIDPNLNTTDNRYRSTGENSSWGSPNRFTTPMLQHAGPIGAELLMYDIHSVKIRGWGIDETKRCSDSRAASGNLAVVCNSISDWSDPQPLHSRPSTQRTTPRRYVYLRTIVFMHSIVLHCSFRNLP